MTSTEYSTYLIFNHKFTRFFYLAILCFITMGVFSQQKNDEADTLFISETEESLLKLAENAPLFQQKSQLDPQTASIYSAVLPGMGQAYNKHYWKIPIIYAGGLGFFQTVRKNNQLYRAFRNALFNEIDLDPTTVSPFPSGLYSTDALRRNTDSFRRNRDFFIILGLLWYGLNIIDAHISAHLDEFDVNDELSFNFSPTILAIPTSPVVAGLMVTMNFN